MVFLGLHFVKDKKYKYAWQTQHNTQLPQWIDIIHNTTCVKVVGVFLILEQFTDLPVSIKEGVGE